MINLITVRSGSWVGKVLLCSCLLIFVSIRINAQMVTVIEDNGSIPIYNVSIIPEGSGKILFTDENGKADLSVVSAGNFVFRHPSYKRLILSASSLTDSNNIIRLQEKIISIDEVVISANKWEQDKSEVPNEILSISPKEIGFNNPQTAADVLQQTGQVFVQKSQLGGGSPMMRGFAANRVLIVVDGVRMNNAIFRSGNLQNLISIDPNILESAEVVFGPGSVVYGSDALGGVMDFHTVKPGFSTEDNPELSLNAFTRYSSANNEKTGHIDATVSGKKISFLSSFSYSDFDDLRSGSKRSSAYADFGKRPFYAERINGEDALVENDNENVQRFSGYNQWSTINKLRYRVNNNLEVSYGLYLANTSDIPRYDRLIQDNGNPDSLRNAEWYYGPQKWHMHHLTATSYRANKLFTEARITATIQKFEETRNDRRFGSESLRVQAESVDVLTLNLDFDKSLGEDNLFYGIEYTYNDVGSSAYRKDIVSNEISETTSRYPDGGSQYATVSGYASHKKKFNDKWILNTGIRFSHVRLRAETTDESAAVFGLDEIALDNSALNGSLGLIYKPNERTKLSLLSSSGFRAPNVDDAGKVFELDDDIVLVPNSDLKPEFSYNWELGMQKKIADKLQFNVVGYYSLLSDAIVRGEFLVNGASTITIDGEEKQIRAQVNANEAYVYGGSATVALDITEAFSVSSSFTLTKGRDKTNDEPLRHTTPNFGRTSIVYKTDKFKGEFFIEYNGARLREDIPTSEIDDKDFLYAFHSSDSNKDGSPAWHTLNLRSSYQLNQYLNITGALENILDTHYRPYSSGISAPGRNVVVSLKASF